MRFFYIFVLGVLAATLWDPIPAGSQANCLDWAEARAVIKQNNLIRPRKILQRLKRAQAGRLISAQLCQDGDRFYYHINLLAQGDRRIVLLVDARTGEHRMTRRPRP